MPNTREKLIELLDTGLNKIGRGSLPWAVEMLADHLIANGVTVQDDMIELICRGLNNIYCGIYGSNKEFDERMDGYNPSAFCAGFEYAIQLAKGLLTQFPQPPKGD